MARTLTIMLMSSPSENEDALFAGKLAEAVRKRGDNVNIFLYGNGVFHSKKVAALEGEPHISQRLLAHLGSLEAGHQFTRIGDMGALITTCQTSEYSRGIQGLPYKEGMKSSDLNQTFLNYLFVSHVFLVLKH